MAGIKKIDLNNIPDNTIKIIIVVFGALFFIPFLGNVHLFDWDEINFAESAREMLVTGDYLNVRVNFDVFWEKPPLFIWFQVVSMKIFGVNEFAARFPNAICGIITLLVLFNIGKNVASKQLAVIWVVLYASSFLPFMYFKSGIIDPFFNLFIFCGIYYAFNYLALEQKEIKNVILSAFFIGLSVLTKGPVGFLIFALSIGVFIISKGFKIKIKIIDLLIFTGVLAFVGGFWFILQILSGNLSIIQDFIVYQIRLFKTKDAGHGGFLLYHFVILLVGVFPASVYALGNLFGKRNNEDITAQYNFWMQILFWTVLILFTIVKTKIVHYSSMCYFPLTFLAAYKIDKVFIGNTKLNLVNKIVYFLIGAMLAMGFILFPLIESNKVKLIEAGIISDSFAIEQLMAKVSWQGWEFLTGVLLIVSMVIIIALMNKKQLVPALITHMLFSVVFLSVVTTYAPRAEKYSQNAIIEFLKTKSDEDAYFQTVGMKSYAHYFYATVSPSQKNTRDEDWLLEGEIDKPVYFIMRSKRKDKFYKEYSYIPLVFDKNGYAVYKRIPSNSKMYDK